MNTPKNSHSATRDERPRSLFEVLFGAKVEDTNLTANVLEKALELRIEQERTKQQYYRLENASRTIELFTMAKEYGVPSYEIPKLFGGEELNIGSSGFRSGASNIGVPTSTVTDCSVKQPLCYKFPPAGSNLRPKPVAGDATTLAARRANSPARIGAYAVAALNEAASLKEEDQQLKFSPFPTNANHSVASHSRNLSLPVAKTAGSDIPSEMTSILSFGKDYNEQISNSAGFGDSNQPGLRKASMVHKKHRRTRSGSSFGVIDLNMVDAHKQLSLPKLKTQVDQLPIQSTEKNPEKRFDYDEITCSENSSRNGSPTQSKNTNSVANLLNSG
ncbi:hypothetical protein HG536_0B03280 [Torulaspora globosa]|uniref:Uncharacterized protein n=1 Tax=Torulaspora globosa TaxID=48254 RepID=A0A7G3ZD79_9SACH|nr:uncharacterized protein HG536_0B03280 [Torulaspora globosa]QLL31465.1 hypothetical protein HG536_0B03280 [Torulaspora globosa]